MEKVECLLSCPNCGEEILDEDATFCPKCGEPLEPEDEMQQNRTDLVLAAAMLTIISAAFSSGIAYIAFFQYNYWFSYYNSLVSNYDPSPLSGFLVLGAFAVVAAVFGLVGGTFMLKRKRIKISMLGVILLVVSVFVTYIIIQYYQYGFTDILLFSETSIFIFSILSGVLIFTSKAEFA
jgi:predicted nucleic acid-binding Zn ribbon protein